MIELLEQKENSAVSMEAALSYAMGLFSDSVMQNEGIPKRAPARREETTRSGDDCYNMLSLPLEHVPSLLRSVQSDR